MNLPGSEIWSKVLEIGNLVEPVLLDCASLPGYDAPAAAARIRALMQRMGRPLKVGLVGEFNTGKSSLINALAGAPVAPVDFGKLTGWLGSYGYSSTERACLHFTDGSSQCSTREEIDQILVDKSKDENWLATLAYVEVSGPYQGLRMLQLWDTPGLSATFFDDQIANRFIQETDAAIWVFDANFVGAEGAAPALKVLHDANKPILGVVNKCEDLSAEELDAVCKRIKRVHGSIAFADIVAVSTKMALDPCDGPESLYVGDLPADGGLSAVRQLLDQHILSDPDRISAVAAAGDMRAEVQAAADYAHASMLRAKRTIWLLDQEVSRSRDEVHRAIDALANTLADEMVKTLRESSRMKVAEEVSAANRGDLASSRWSKNLMRDVFSPDRVKQLCRAFLTAQNDRLRVRVRVLLSDQMARLHAELAPGELEGIMLQSDAVLSSVGLAAEDLRRSETVRDWLAGIGWAAIGASVLMFVDALITGGVVTAMLGLGAWLARYASNVDTEVLRNRVRHECENAVDRYINDNQLAFRNWVRSQVTAQEDVVTTVLEQGVCAALLQGRSRDDVERTRLEGERLHQELSRHASELGRISRTGDSADVLRRSAVIGAGDRSHSYRLMAAILAEGRNELSITDGDLSPSAIRYLAEAGPNTPLRIITWGWPLSEGRAAAFADAVADLRKVRTGSVTVVIPKMAASTTRDIRPTGCWFFTDQGIYHFDASLQDVLDPQRDVRFNPVEEDGAVHFTEFRRWWEDQVPGYQAIQTV